MARDDYGAISVISDDEKAALGIGGPKKPEEEEKLFEISQWHNRVHAIDTLLNEMNKCDVICANCHAELHSCIKKTEVYLRVNIKESI